MVLEPEGAGLFLEFVLVGAGAGDDEPHVAEVLDDPRQRLERELEALLVDEPAGEDDELLVGGCELRAVGDEVVDGREVGGIDAVRDHVDRGRRQFEDLAAVLLHVVGAGDDARRLMRHPALDAVDVRLRVALDPALVAPVLGGVHGDDPRPHRLSAASARPARATSQS